MAQVRYCLNSLFLLPPNCDRWAKFEERENELGNAREIYEKALEVLEDEQESHAELYIAFALMEERAREVTRPYRPTQGFLTLQYERARAIYKYALDRISKADAKELFTKFIQFEKQFGDKVSFTHMPSAGECRSRYRTPLNTSFSANVAFSTKRCSLVCDLPQLFCC